MLAIILIVSTALENCLLCTDPVLRLGGCAVVHSHAVLWSSVPCGLFSS